MEDYEGIAAAESEATENDWLDVTYTAKKYLDETPKAKRKVFGGTKIRKAAIYSAAAAVCAALVAVLIFGGGNTFETARATVTSSVLNRAESAETNKITVTLPVTMTVSGVEEGVVTFGGGRAVLSFTDGTVEKVEEGSVTVAVDENTKIVYGDVTKVFVTEGEVVKANQLLAKYNETASARIVYGGETVQSVVGSETQISWSV